MYENNEDKSVYSGTAMYEERFGYRSSGIFRFSRDKKFIITVCTRSLGKVNIRYLYNKSLRKKDEELRSTPFKIIVERSERINKQLTK